MDGQQRVVLVETRTQGDDGSPEQLIRYQLGNHLGSACLELGETGQIISYEEYYPYGSTSYQAVHSQTETPKRYRYTGMERDEETGLAYHGARYCSPWLGRWTSTDPAGLVDGTNLYLYVRNNSIALHDPSGTTTLDELPANIRPPNDKGAEREIMADVHVRLKDGEFQLKYTGDVYYGPDVSNEWQACTTSCIDTWSDWITTEKAASISVSVPIAFYTGGIGWEAGEIFTAISSHVAHNYSAYALGTGITIGFFDETGTLDLPMPDPTDVGRGLRAATNETAPMLDEILELAPKLEAGWENKMDELYESGRALAMARIGRRVPGVIEPIANVAYREGLLTHYANHIHGLVDNLAGETVEIAMITRNGNTEYVAGINSAAQQWAAAQIDELNRLGIQASPLQAVGITRAPHAEENIGAYLEQLIRQGDQITVLAWSKAVVGNKTGYICSACWDVVRRFGGTVERRSR